jgi:hypothetical protein
MESLIVWSLVHWTYLCHLLWCLLDWLARNQNNVSEWSDMSRPANCRFSELALWKFNSACWSSTKWISSSCHWKLTYSLIKSFFVILFISNFPHCSVLAFATLQKNTKKNIIFWKLTCSRHDMAENWWIGVKHQSLTHCIIIVVKIGNWWLFFIVSI